MNLFEVLYVFFFNQSNLFDLIYKLAQDENTHVIQLIVIIAGFSTALSRLFILFINKIPLKRMLVILSIEAFGFFVSFIMIVFNFVIMFFFIYKGEEPFILIPAIIAVGYIPKFFNFLGFVPYLGRPLNIIFNIWSLFLTSSIFAIIYQLDFYIVLAALGSTVLLTAFITFTIGRPFVWLSYKVKNLAAGSKIEKNYRLLLDKDIL